MPQRKPRVRKRALFSIVPAALLVALIPRGSAEAQILVTDGLNLLENEIAAAQSILQVKNQIEMLKSLDLNMATLVRTDMDWVYALSGQVTGSYAFSQPMAGISDFQLRALEARWIQERRVAALHALQVQQIVINAMPGTSTRMELVGNASSFASGQTSAMQANTQMLGQLGAELHNLQATTVAAHRMAAVKEAERASWLEFFRDRRNTIHRDDHRTYPKVRVTDPFPRSR